MNDFSALRAFSMKKGTFFNFNSSLVTLSQAHSGKISLKIGFVLSVVQLKKLSD
jgi:hypothetical protein